MSTPQAVTNEVLSLQVAHLQQSFNEERVQSQKERSEIRDLIKEHATRIRSVEDAKLQVWTIVGVITVFGLSGAAAFIKWLLSN